MSNPYNSLRYVDLEYVDLVIRLDEYWHHFLIHDADIFPSDFDAISDVSYCMSNMTKYPLNLAEKTPEHFNPFF